MIPILIDNFGPLILHATTSTLALKVLSINKYHYLKGGADNIYLQGSKLLEKKGHEVIHFSTVDKRNESSSTSEYFVTNPDFLNKSRIKQLLLSVRYLYSYEAKRKLKRLIKDHKPDVAHLHIFFGEISLSILPVLKKAGIPVVMTLHEYKMLCPAYTLFDQNMKICEKCATGNYIPSVIKRCVGNNFLYSMLSATEGYFRDWIIPYEKYIDHFFTYSDFSSTKHLEYKTGLSKKMSYLNNFIQVPEQVDHSHHENYYLYFGRLSREKGLLTLLKAIKQEPEVVLKIAGEGPLRSVMEEYCKANDLKNVKFLGYLEKEQLNAVIRNATFTIAPSEWYETFGMNILESMSLGTPVIVSKIGGMKELVKEGKTGFLIKPGEEDSILDCIRSLKNIGKNEYIKLSTQCYEFSKNFSEESHYRTLIKVYESQIAMKKINIQSHTKNTNMQR